ncbi:hypothetical protein BJ165DRAFT_1530099 [Panaeolus papilionaceus]|nr:hypothetical protein BJ165DRAFT_1530099 [Panaeolus papilionaceus]
MTDLRPDGTLRAATAMSVALSIPIPDLIKVIFIRRQLRNGLLPEEIVGLLNPEGLESYVPDPETLEIERLLIRYLHPATEDEKSTEPKAGSTSFTTDSKDATPFKNATQIVDTVIFRDSESFETPSFGSVAPGPSQPPNNNASTSSPGTTADEYECDENICIQYLVLREEGDISATPPASPRNALRAYTTYLDEYD